MSENPTYRTTIDLQIIQGQLDEVEKALLSAWRHLGRVPHMPEQSIQLSDAIDTLLAVKMSLGLTSDLIPVKEYPSASSTVIIPQGPASVIQDEVIEVYAAGNDDGEITTITTEWYVAQEAQGMLSNQHTFRVSKTLWQQLVPALINALQGGQR